MESLLCVANGPGAKPRGTTNGTRSEVRLSGGQRAVNGGSRRSPPDLLLQLLDALGDDAHELIDLVGGDGQRRGPAQRPAPRGGDRPPGPPPAVAGAHPPCVAPAARPPRVPPPRRREAGPAAAAPGDGA